MSKKVLAKPQPRPAAESRLDAFVRNGAGSDGKGARRPG